MQKRSQKSKLKALVIVGPTSSGKSALAVQLAKKFNGEVISADSRQVYKGLDIGTGKITKREMKGIPHYLLDVASPKKTFTAHDFSKKAKQELKRIEQKGKLPIVVGGTGFYIDGLFGRLSFSAVPPNKALRTKLSKKTAEQLFAMLKKSDSRRAKTMDTPSERNNKVRLIRALEVATSKARQLSQDIKGSPVCETHWIGVAPKQQVLVQKIEKRLKARIKQGMIAEARRLHADGLSYKRMESLGLEYRSLARLLQNKITRNEFEEELLRDIRRYAKKQLVYWKRNTGIQWYDPKQTKAIGRDVAAWLKVS